MLIYNTNGLFDLVSKLVGRKAHFLRKLDVLMLQLVCALSQACHVVMLACLHLAAATATAAAIAAAV